MVTLTPLASPSTPPLKLGFRPDIQGLRAVAVLLVVIYHAGVTFLSGGYVGVDVFFVISGFLITTHLLESLARDGRIRLGQFYAKRARRILPASLTVLVLTVLAALIWMPPLQLGSVFRGAIATALYVPNMLFAREGTNYLSETAPSVFQHFWSLGIEEQFYLIWPLALLLIFRLLKSERSAFWVVSGLVLASFALCLVVIPLSQPWAFFSLPTRAWELGAGALMAFIMRSHGERLAASRSGVLAWVGLIALLVIGVTYSSGTPFPGHFAAAPVIATAMIIAGGVGHSSPVRLLSSKPLQFVGLISYSLYLVHWPLLVIPQAAAGMTNPLPLPVTLGLGALSFPVAYLLYRFVEDPARRFKPLAKSRPLHTLLAVGVTTAVIVGASATTMKVTEQQPLHAGQSVDETAPQPFPLGHEFVPSNLQPTLRTAASDNPLVYTNGCHRDNNSVDASGCQFGTNQEAPLVALFGDSHATSWFPALHAMAEDGALRLDVNTKSSCTSVDVPAVRYGQPYPSCKQWRAKVTERLVTARPDVVLLANRSISPLEDGSIETVTQWRDAVAKTVETLSKATQVGVIADVPDMGATPAICLSDNLESAADCARPRMQAFAAEVAAAEQAATESNDGTYLNLNDYLCNATACPAMIGGQLVYRDAHHLTATFSESMQRPLARELDPLLS